MRFRSVAAHAGVLALSLGALAFGPSPLQALNALLLAHLIVQFGLLAHDASHRQIVRSFKGSRALAFVLWNLVCGISVSWWRDKHSRHHRHPHEHGRDPDLYAIFSFSAEEARARTGVRRWLARHQAAWFPLALCVTAAYFQALSLAFAVRGRRHGESAALLLRHLLLLGAVWGLLGLWAGAGFLLLHYAAAGLYLGAVFACNHYGLPVLARGSAPPEPERTFLVTRNVRTGALGDYLFGGLNYQIEHHLRPAMPRRELRAAAERLRAQRRSQGLTYHETTWAQALQAVFRQLHLQIEPARHDAHVAP